MALQKLSDVDHAQQIINLDQIWKWAFEIRRDIGGEFRMHEVKGSPDIAVSDPKGEWNRCYAVPSEGEWQLVIDDVIFDSDDVDLHTEVFWDSAAGTWDTRPVSE